jgi:hypothetical protein
VAGQLCSVRTSGRTTFLIPPSAAPIDRLGVATRHPSKEYGPLDGGQVLGDPLSDELPQDRVSTKAGFTGQWPTGLTVGADSKA